MIIVAIAITGLWCRAMCDHAAPIVKNTSPAYAHSRNVGNPGSGTSSARTAKIFAIPSMFRKYSGYPSEATPANICGPCDRSMYAPNARDKHNSPVKIQYPIFTSSSWNSNRSSDFPPLDVFRKRMVLQMHSTGPLISQFPTCPAATSYIALAPCLGVVSAQPCLSLAARS
jgi:hypothetical protein